MGFLIIHIMFNKNYKLLLLCLVLINGNVLCSMEKCSNKEISNNYCSNNTQNTDSINNNSMQNNNSNDNVQLNDEMNKCKQQYKGCIEQFNKIYKQLMTCKKSFDNFVNALKDKSSKNIKNIESQMTIYNKHENIEDIKNKYINAFKKSITMTTLQQFKECFDYTIQEMRIIKTINVNLLSTSYNALLKEFDDFNSKNLNDDLIDVMELQFFDNLKNIMNKISILSNLVNTIVSELQQNTCKLVTTIKNISYNNEQKNDSNAAFLAYVCVSSCSDKISKFCNDVHSINHLPYYNDNIFEYA